MQGTIERYLGRARINPPKNMTMMESFGSRSDQRNLATRLVGADLPALKWASGQTAKRGQARAYRADHGEPIARDLC